MRLTRALGGILFLALIDNPVQALGATLPVSYSVTLAWDSSPSPEVTGYRVYYGEASRDYPNSVLVGNVTTNTVAGLARGVTYFFAVTAYNASGLESAFSSEVSFVAYPATLRIRILAAGQAILTIDGPIGQMYDILATQTGTGWAVIGAVTLDASGSADFTDINAARFPMRLYRIMQKP